MEAHHSEVVVVTGVSAGVGRAVARAFAARGAHLGLLARGEDRLEDTRREVEELGGRSLALLTDVTSATNVEGAAAAVERELGPIDVWVNGAMAAGLAGAALALTGTKRRRSWLRALARAA